MNTQAVGPVTSSSRKTAPHFVHVYPPGQLSTPEQLACSQVKTKSIHIKKVNMLSLPIIMS